ncbi:uncharacterized protein YecE (DUF72 family) [Pedobacter sp. AK017]|uniref:DUF72 domain-containing protein n=1 Tax=Pedobacter sp. AK017 TaxID=2723073 RepID=UPI0016096869|nr:DUF72 domain-containing protein [Pedobacter sp. AK017]MBB5436412.1 uncharacterized protein YecE (DUF72 family) [Pedobacter sp. AK017]
MEYVKGTVYYSGTSGLLLPVPNKEFYPEEFKAGSRLSYYASLFNSIEINSTFYKMPMASTVARWAADTPAGFKFTFKLWQEITHRRNLDFEPEAVAEFMNRIASAGSKKGCLLVQFPASIKPVHIRELTKLLNCIRRADPDLLWHIAVEFRHQSWYRQDTYDLLEEFSMAPVLHDKLSEGGQLLNNSLDFVYLRFHGPEGDYKGSYPDDFLYEYATYIRDWLVEGKEVYSYFNNTMGNAIGNMELLRKYVHNNADNL